MAQTIVEWLVTRFFIEQFERSLAESENDPYDLKRNRLWQAEQEGYQSILTELYAEAVAYETDHIRLQYESDDALWCATCDQDIMVQGTESTQEGAIRELARALRMKMKIGEWNDNV